MCRVFQVDAVLRQNWWSIFVSPISFTNGSENQVFQKNKFNFGNTFLENNLISFKSRSFTIFINLTKR